MTELTESERMSALWQKLAQHYGERLSALRAKNDKPGNPDDTARLRGRIAEVKALLSLGQPKTPIPSDANLFDD